MVAPPKKNKGQFQPGNKVSLGNEGGRPELYTPEWIEEEAKLLLEWFQQPRNIWLKGFALTRGYDPARLDEFADKSPVFSQALIKAKEWQQYKLVDMGLFNETNPSITKFVLINNHGWADKSQAEQALAQQLAVGIVNYSEALKREEGWQPPKKS
jgi:hypothetical protein